MDALIAILTPGFNESKWTDQEIGVAIGRKVPIVPIRIGLDPYGFIGKYQALQGAGRETDGSSCEPIEALTIDDGSKGPEAIYPSSRNSREAAYHLLPIGSTGQRKR